MDDKIFFFERSSFFGSFFGGINVFIQKHSNPPLDLFLNFGKLFNRHYKLVLTFTGGVMDVKLFFFERSSFFGSFFGGINVFIQKHSNPPIDLFLNFGRLFTRHHKLV